MNRGASFFFPYCTFVMDISCPYTETVIVLLNIVINKQREHFQTMYGIATENMICKLSKTLHFSIFKVILPYLIRI